MHNFKLQISMSAQVTMAGVIITAPIWLVVFIATAQMDFYHTMVPSVMVRESNKLAVSFYLCCVVLMVSL